MSSWTDRLKHQISPRLRMFFARLFLIIVTWLAVTGAIEMIRGNATVSPLLLVGWVIGCALAAIFKPVPTEDHQPAE